MMWCIKHEQVSTRVVGMGITPKEFCLSCETEGLEIEDEE